MADVDINSFGEHESRPEEPTDETFLFLQLPQEVLKGPRSAEEDQLGNQNVNRKHHSEEESLKEPN